MPRAFTRSILTLFLITMAGALFWYGVSVNRLAVRDLVFLKNHFQLLQPFADAWLLRGNLAYYQDLDAEAAAADYRQAIAREPLLIAAWLNLAKAELAAGREGEARRILQTLSPIISHVSTWKWQELLLAIDLRDEELFSAAFNFVLARLPKRVKEACFLARGFWGSNQAILPYLTAGSRQAFLDELMKEKESETAFALWKIMKATAPPPEKALGLRLCQFFLANGKVVEAKNVWASWRDDGKQTVYDGGFEKEPTNRAFGWCLVKNPNVVIERTSESPVDGKQCLHLRFPGTKNISFSQVHQLIPVEPGKVYRLSFARGSRGLTTDQGVFIEVSGWQCEGLRVSSEPVRGNTPWATEELAVPVPEGCEAIYLKVRRNESLKFDNRIAGDYWLDRVELSEQHAP
jgi:hypothetical protein